MTESIKAWQERCSDCDRTLLEGVHPDPDCSRVLPSADDIRDYLSWASETLPTTPEANAVKLVEEAGEVREEPRSAEEMADVLMVLCYQAWIAGVDLAEAFRKKLEKNRTRTWTQGEDGQWRGSK